MYCVSEEGVGSRESTGTAGLGDLRDWLAWYRTHTQKVAKQAHVAGPAKCAETYIV